MTNMSNDEYRDHMECPMESLAFVLDGMGVTEAMSDAELVEFATKKLKTLYKMLLASGMQEGLLKTIMSE